MELNLTREDVEELVSVVEERLSELREEIYHADVSTFHDELKKREQLLKDIVAKLKSSA